LTWNDATLERWLSDPDMVVPDNNMSFRSLLKYSLNVPITLEIRDAGGSPNCDESLLGHPRALGFRAIRD
jgi:hypothetical protein